MTPPPTLLITWGLGAALLLDTGKLGEVLGGGVFRAPHGQRVWENSERSPS